MSSSRTTESGSGSFMGTSALGRSESLVGGEGDGQGERAIVGLMVFDELTLPLWWEIWSESREGEDDMMNSDGKSSRSLNIKPLINGTVP